MLSLGRVTVQVCACERRAEIRKGYAYFSAAFHVDDNTECRHGFMEVRNVECELVPVKAQDVPSVPAES